MRSHDLKERVLRDLKQVEVEKRYLPTVNLRKGFCTPYKKTYLDQDADLVELWLVFEFDSRQHRKGEVVWDEQLGRYGVALNRVFPGHCLDFYDAMWEADKAEEECEA